MINDLQKASITKRISAYLLDFILAAIIFTGSLWLFSSVIGYDAQVDKMSEIRNEIEIEFGIPAITQKYEVTLDDFQYLTQEQKDKIPEDVQNTMKECILAINKDSSYNKALAIILNLTLIMISFSLLTSILVTEFIIPLIFKNGQTLGKKIFSLGVMRNDGIKISPMLLFVRAILGKYTVETMVPMLMIFMLIFSPSIIPIAVVLILALIQIILLIVTRTNSLIHDTLSSTVVIDFASQMIFDSVEAKREYQLRIHKEEAEKSDY